MKNVDGQTDVGHINLIGGLVTRKPPKKAKNAFGEVLWRSVDDLQ